LYWPPFARTSKSLVFFAISMNATMFSETHSDRHETEIATMRTFLNESRQLNRNIVLSTEAFDFFTPAMIATLQSYLEGFNVTIVMVYRELLSQLISNHFENNRFEHDSLQFSGSFAVDVFKTMDDLPRPLRSLDIMNDFVAVFGADHVRVVDLVGTVAAKKDIAYVILCEIAGVLCDKPALFATKSNSTSNPRFSLISAQVFSLYKNFATMHKCAFVGSKYKEYLYFLARFNDYVKTHALPPTAQSNLTMLRPYVLQVDSAFREKYSTVMLYGDRAANEQSIASAHVSELDVEQFISDPGWDSWIRAEYHLAHVTGRLCNCTSHIH